MFGGGFPFGFCEGARRLSFGVRPLMPAHTVCRSVAGRQPSLPVLHRSATFAASTSSLSVLRAGCPSFGGQRKAVAARDSTKAAACRCTGRHRGSGQRSRCRPAEVARTPPPTAHRRKQDETAPRERFAPVRALAHHRGATHSQGHK